MIAIGTWLTAKAGSSVVKSVVGFIRRYWLVIVIACFVFHYVGLRVTISEQEHRIDGYQERMKTYGVVVESAKALQEAARELQVVNEELAEINDRISTDAAKWEQAFSDAEARPPVVHVEYLGRIDGTTPGTMAESGAKIASEIAEAVRARREGGGP